MILVMKEGKIVEEGATDEIFGAARSDYTRALIGAAIETGDVMSAG